MSLLKIVLAGGAAGIAGVLLLVQPGKDQRDVSFDVAPKSGSVIFNSAVGNDLYTLDPSTLKVRDLAHAPTAENSPAFSPDGRRVVYSATAGGSPAAHLYTHSRADGKRTQLTGDARANDSMASYSADGTQIVFTRALRHRPYSMGGWTWDKWDIYTVHADGITLRRLTSQSYSRADSPRFTPDGQAVIFSADTVDPNSYLSSTNIYRVSLAGKAPPKPLTSNGHSSAPVFTPEGEHIIYISDATIPFEYEIWSMNADGTHPVQLTHEHCDLEDPAVTPDGKHILALANRGELIRYDLEEFDKDGTHPRQLADSTLFDDPLRWKPR